MIAVFPGQGSQHVGMLKELFENFKIARETFEEASDASNLNIKKLSFDGPESELTLTEFTQPCLLTASVAAFRVAQSELGFKPDIVAGHSLGEYSALVAAGCLPLSAAARWVRERGAAMQKAVPAGEGTMAAIMGLEDEQVEALCKKATAQAQTKRSKGETEEISVAPVVEPANFNSPGQVVIAGSVDGVGEALEIIKAGDVQFSGAKAIPLSVSAPFHSSLMKPARERMAALFSEAKPGEKPASLLCPYVPNRTARLNTESSTVFELLVEQVDHPVLWKQSMEALFHQGKLEGVEFGPGKVLQGLAKRIGMKSGHKPNFTGLNDLNSFKNLQERMGV